MLYAEKFSKYALAAELSRVALVVCEWADASESSLFTAEMSLMALTRAAMCIPLDESTTGISPITPFLSLLGSMEDATLTYQKVMEASYEPTIKALLKQARQLYSDLRNHHASFLCTQSHGYKTTNTDEPRMVRFSYDNVHLFVGTDESAAWILNTATGESFTVSTAQLPSSLSFLYANFTRDGKHVYWGSREGPLYLFKLDTGEAAPVEGLGYGRRSRVVAISHDEMHVLVTNETNSAAICDAATGETLMTFEGHSKRLCRAAFASVLPPREEAAGSTPEVYTTMHPVVPDEFEEPPMSERPRLATSSFDNTVRIWDVDTGSCVAIFDDLGHSVNGVCWSPDATLLAITCSKTVRVYEAATRGLKCELEGHTELVCNAAFSPNGKLLVSASNDHTVRVWNVAKKTCIAVLTGPDDDVNDVEFSPDGRFIAAAADDSVWIWEVNPFSVHRTTDSISMIQGFGKKQKDKIENMADFNS
jgi:WD40 repeat protein